MIGKTMHNESFLATCAYVARNGAIHLGGNALGVTPRQLAREFGLLSSLKPNLKRPVVHLVGAFAPGDHLTDDEMLVVACRLVEEQGYQNSLYTVWRHLDGTTEHFHVVTSQVDINGATIGNSFERYRTKRSCRKLETEFGLAAVSNIRNEEPEPPSPPPPKPEPDGLDVELPGVGTVVGEAFGREIQEALPACETFGDLAKALSQKGLRMVPQIHSENGQLYGMGFRMEKGPLAGSYITGSKIPGNFSASKLVTKHGLSFEPDRDLPILREPNPKPPPAKAAVPETPKPRRRKKGDRKNAKRQRKQSRHNPCSAVNPWLPNPDALQARRGAGDPPSGTGLGSPFLGHPGGWAAAGAPAQKPLFPRIGTCPWRMARNH